MIVSALLTSVGINLGLCVLFFALYSVLRKQPCNLKVYAPRLVAEGRAGKRSHFNIEGLLPSAGWVRRAWQPSEDELLNSCGLDGVVFNRIFIFRLWVHFSAAYFITGVVCYLLYATDTENLYRRITHLKSRPSSSQNQSHTGFLGLFRKNGDLMGHYEKKLEDLKQNVRLQQSDTSTGREEVPAAFVCFRSRYGAAKALHIRQSTNPTEWVTEHAPEPHDVYWPFFSTSFTQRWISKLVVLVASVLLIVLFLLVVAFVQGLTYLEQLEALLPFLKNILKM
ncbi:hypothetical protein BHE74_00005451 [Ensete ventricosum]|nr:hypothetical protein GW17_00019843 [Ensete ventricosum]RWW85844.1 hypothetical protein BHE74_00005451 [Ensete ventricosum]